VKFEEHYPHLAGVVAMLLDRRPGCDSRTSRAWSNLFLHWLLMSVRMSLASEIP